MKRRPRRVVNRIANRVFERFIAEGGEVFHYDRGLWITSIGLAVDIPRQQKLGFISHAHADHAARHQLILCSPATAELLKARYGRISCKPIEFDKPVTVGDTELSLHPAGHMHGSSMLFAQTVGGSLLFTGDFRLGQSLTAGQAAPPRADVLIMECTFGSPQYVFPPREEAIASLLGIIRTIRGAGKIAHIHAYAMGKSQEIVAILNRHGFKVQVDRAMAPFCKAYENSGASLGEYQVYGESSESPDVVITPPRKQSRSGALRRECRTIAVTGWAIDPALTRRWGVDYAVPLSDHADYNELLQLVEMVRPTRVYCTHGTRAFAEDLRARGFQAENLDPASNRSAR